MSRIGFDIGGTFTDFALERPGRPLFFHKVSSTPADPSQAVARGIAELVELAGVKPEEIASVLHATTVATNAILERKGARTALITTAGFRDVIFIGRQKRYDVFDLYLKKPRPLLQRRDVFEVEERLAADGTVLRGLDAESLDRAVEAVVAGDYASVAVCLLHSFANPGHERQVFETLRSRAPGLSVTISSDVSPRYREYERTSTTVTNAYVQPTVSRYVDQLQRVLETLRIRSALSIMQSNGGLVSPEVARTYPVRIVESGPAAGVLMCAEVGRELGLSQLLSFDMGGTTAKLGAIDGGRPSIAATFEVDMVRFLKGSGLPLNISSIELLEIGAGGGSIAGVEMGLITVGPHSAGSDPGPMCYGAGGTKPTVTDANVVLGYIDPDNFNGGAIRLDLDAARRGVRETIAEPLGLSEGHAAWGIHAMVSSSMERALRIVSIERGRDPREYAMVAFGGAGPIHAARLARQVGIRRVIVPHGAGVGSAVGLLRARPKVDASFTRIVEIREERHEAIRTVFAELRERVLRELAQMGERSQALAWSNAASMRYRGQGHELRVELSEDPSSPTYVQHVLQRFEEAYKRNYGYTENGAPVEATEWYLAAELQAEGGEAQAADAAVSSSALKAPDAATPGRKPARRQRLAYFPEAGEYRSVPIVERASIAPGERIVGPAVIEEREATTVILEGDEAFVGRNGHLIIDIAGQQP
ncbi:hydantoinase/oxoprolinase family protein [Ramlibacter sp.]|uniref:hydantoinase/oxoprolinase family protein n=1 Tax=Ramlibacter sp. TaxID=1917967 RepID=UPI003D114AD4